MDFWNEILGGALGASGAAAKDAPDPASTAAPGRNGAVEPGPGEMYVNYGGRFVIVPIDATDDEIWAAIRATYADTTPREDRVGQVMSGSGGHFEVADNPDADGSAPIYELPAASLAQLYGPYIDVLAPEKGVDPDLVRAIMHMESTHGYYDYIFGPFGLNNSLLPMNVRVPTWGDRFGGRAALKSPYNNISAGIDILAGIIANMPGDPRIEQIATLYNNLNATRVNDYGARVGEIYRNQLWRDAPKLQSPSYWPAQMPTWSFW